MYLYDSAIGKAAAPSVVWENSMSSKEQMGNPVLPSWLFTDKKEKNLILSHANMHTDLQCCV